MFAFDVSAKRTDDDDREFQAFRLVNGHHRDAAAWRVLLFALELPYPPVVKKPQVEVEEYLRSILYALRSQHLYVVQIFELFNYLRKL